MYTSLALKLPPRCRFCESSTCITNVVIGSSNEGTNNVLQKTPTRIGGKGFQYFRVDQPHFDRKGKPSSVKVRGKETEMNYNHINLDYIDKNNTRYEKIKLRYNHYRLSNEAYAVLKDLDRTAKFVRVGGRVLAVGGIAMDALELINTIECDLKDADKKIGKKTYSDIVSIGGRWTGAWIGAKLGAEGGAAFGTYIYPGIGTLIGGVGGSLILGCVGAFGGGEFAKWVVDVSNVEGENYVIKKMDK